MKRVRRAESIFAMAVVFLSLGAPVCGQRGPAKPVTVPVTIRLREKPVEIRIVDFILREDGEIQRELSRRDPRDSPMTLAILFQDDLVSSISVEARTMADFIRNQPGSSSVMVGYISQGSLEVRRRLHNEM